MCRKDNPDVCTRSPGFSRRCQRAWNPHEVTKHGNSNTLPGWGWNWLVRIVLGSPARDVDCAFKLFRRDVLDRIAIRSRGATFSAEFIVRARRAGCRIHQVPVRHLPRLAGSPTGGRIDVIARAFRELVALRIALWRRQ